MKFSRYNLFFSKGNGVFAYNSRVGSFLDLTKPTYRLIDEAIASLLRSWWWGSKRDGNLYGTGGGLGSIKQEQSPKLWRGPVSARSDLLRSDAQLGTSADERGSGRGSIQLILCSPGNYPAYCRRGHGQTRNS